MSGRDGGTQRRRVPDSRQREAAARPLRNTGTGRVPRQHSLQGDPRRGPYRDAGARATGAPRTQRPRALEDRTDPRRGPRRPEGWRPGATGYQERSSGSRQKPDASKIRQAPPPSTASAAVGVLRTAGRALGGVLAAIGRTYASLWARSKAVAIGVLCALAVAVVVLFGAIMPHDRIAEGIHVGEVDVSGMTVSEATTAVSDKYDHHLNATTVYIFADEETAKDADIELQMIENEALAEQLSFEEAQSNKKLWIASADSLSAVLPAREMAEEALSLGSDLGLFGRMGATEADLTITPRATYDENLLLGLISDINLALGSEVEDYSLSIDGEDVSVVEGKEGYLLDNEEFTRRLSEVLLVDASSLQSFVADVRPTTYRIDEGMAHAAKAAIEAAVPEAVEFASEEKTVSFDRKTLMSWIATRASERDGGWYLEPYIEEVQASKDILEAVNVHSFGEDVTVSIDVGEDGSAQVHSSKDVSVPNIEGALAALDGDLFDAYRSTLEASPAQIEGSIGITMNDGRSSFGLEEALSYGLVTEFSRFTTQFTNTSSTVNRRDNIHLVSDAITNTVAKADGGSWSFLDHAGPMDEDDGYKDANQIVGGRMEQGVGGGVCQVATTVFNAVYEAGLDIDERHNHSLYSSSYPAGLDAAVSYPGLDLVWSNQTSSDVLLRTSYTDSSVTVALIGIDPELEVVTETGEWEEGKKHVTEYEADETLKEGASYVKTAGADGMKISVTRYVKNKDGKTVGWDTFASVYSPVNRLIAYGKGSDLAQIKEKYAEDEDDDE